VLFSRVFIVLTALRLLKLYFKLFTATVVITLLGVHGCQELSVSHVCRNHYTFATLSTKFKSFQSVAFTIRRRILLNSKQASKKCVRNLELFMCSLYVPQCTASDQNQTPLGPCRSQCKTTVRRCTGIIEGLITLLPELGNCGQFPLTGCTANKRKIDKTHKNPANPKKSAK